MKFLCFTLITTISLAACDADGWRTARNDSAGIAPKPEVTLDAVVQVYGAGVYGWRGILADHTWIAVKPAGAAIYTTYQVVGWRLRRGKSVVLVEQGVPDRHWYGSSPTLYLDLRGKEAATLIPRIEHAAASYPYDREYTLWPGPNSNSFTQWVALEVPDLGLELPWRAWGKNWMIDKHPDSSGNRRSN